MNEAQTARQLRRRRGPRTPTRLTPSESARRSDADIARSAETALQRANYLPKDQIKVMIDNGWITLSGEVYWEYQRQAAVRMVRNLIGVRGVSDAVLFKANLSVAVAKRVAQLLRQGFSYIPARRSNTDLPSKNLSSATR